MWKLKDKRPGENSYPGYFVDTSKGYKKHNHSYGFLQPP
jgi:hypothetical protein